ncbi:hypothetical protein B0H11DRAFT_204189 [Mycena galericulata]|nr:hypothetical protein B0H11DRAFT_204189 [Mycena galericulata]
MKEPMKAIFLPLSATSNRGSSALSPGVRTTSTTTHEASTRSETTTASLVVFQTRLLSTKRLVSFIRRRHLPLAFTRPVSVNQILQSSCNSGPILGYWKKSHLASASAEERKSCWLFFLDFLGFAPPKFLLGQGSNARREVLFKMITSLNSTSLRRAT